MKIIPIVSEEEFTNLLSIEEKLLSLADYCGIIFVAAGLNSTTQSLIITIGTTRSVDPDMVRMVAVRSLEEMNISNFTISILRGSKRN